MDVVNPITSYPIGAQVEDINGVPMRGVPEKQGWSFSAHGYLQARQSGGDADAIGAAVRRVLRPLSGPMLYRARKEYAAREVVKFPRYFIIEPTALCNRRCPFCSILVTNRGGMMTWRHFVKLMEECGKHEVYGLSLYQLGEPLLWRGDDPFGARLRITDMVNTAKSLGGFRAVNISTNGDVKNLNTLLDSQLDDLIISIDGMTPDVYSANRPSTKSGDDGAFDRTHDRVMAFLDEKARRGLVRPFVRMQIINKDNTADQVLDFIRHWITVPGVDDVFIKNLDSMRPWLGNKIVSDDEDAIKARRMEDMPCQHIYAVGSMTVDGRFNACCHDALTELTTAQANIDEMTFARWWNGDYMRALRYEHEGGALRRPCAECREKDTWLG